MPLLAASLNCWKARTLPARMHTIATVEVSVWAMGQKSVAKPAACKIDHKTIRTPIQTTKPATDNTTTTSVRCRNAYCFSSQLLP